VVEGHPLARFLSVGDFMFMGKIIRRGGARRDLYLYKHRYTRRYVHLDDTGATYRFIAARSPYAGRLGQHRPRSVTDALYHLQLWHLPWMKPGLERERCGLPYEDAWMLLPDSDVEDDPAPPTTGRRRGLHLA
jgi:hypothetical protein